jgi:DNA polymerase (family 10)
VQNAELAAALDDVADLLELKGSNPFQIRAYRNAARTVESLSRSVAAMIRAGEDPAALPGVGPRIAGYLRELVETGTLATLEELRRSFPPGLVALTRLPGLGPKKAAALWTSLQIGSIDELEAAIKDGRVATVRGFGAASAAKLLEAIGATREARERTLRVKAERLVAGILAWMKDAPGMLEIKVAGSMRRRVETVADVDLLARAEGDGTPVVSHFTAFPGASRVEASGSTKGSIVLRSGLQVDLRVIPSESWGAALHYFTGSKEHNVHIRQLAKKRGLKVSEWGVFRGEEEAGERIAGATEEELFAALDLPWIPPELREDRGEFEVAAKGALPRLLTLRDLKGDLQMHSTWSDGRFTIEQMALACRDLGYEYLAMTDHSGGALTMVNGLTAERARAQWAEIEEVRARVDGIRILRSMEVDILQDGSLDMDDETLAGLDLVLVSVHSFMKMDGAAMTERVLKAIQHPEVDILGHPTGRILSRRPSFAIDMEAVLQAAAELDVAVEINASPNRLDLSDVHAFRARELGVRIVVSTDAHTKRELENMRYGVDQARRAWCEAGHVLNTLSWKDFSAWLRRRAA